MATPFSACLARTRAWAGFKTAHEFYAKSGGAGVLRLSWVAYRKMEKGLILPKPGRLSLLVSLLRLPPACEQAQRLVRAYLMTLLGSEDTYRWAMGLATGIPASTGSSDMGERALQRLTHAETHQLSHEQDQVIIADYAAYWIFMVLCGGKRDWKVSELAAKLRLARSKVLAALRRLARVKAVEFLKDGAVRCLLADKKVQLLPQGARPARDAGKIPGYHDRMAKNGALLWHAFSLPRASELELADYYPRLTRGVRDVHVLARSERDPGDPPTPLFLVEGRIYRLPL